MRLWTLHPRYLDPAGLVAVWREGLLAQKVLSGVTTGYRQHPQLQRFRASPEPMAAIACYLEGVWREAERRGYRFDRLRIRGGGTVTPLDATDGQVRFEWRHLLEKIGRRNPGLVAGLEGIDFPLTHPLFQVVEGPVEAWERASPRRPRGTLP